MEGRFSCKFSSTISDDSGSSGSKDIRGGVGSASLVSEMGVVVGFLAPGVAGGVAIEVFLGIAQAPRLKAKKKTNIYRVKFFIIFFS
jgi:hypothetical protein